MINEQRVAKLFKDIQDGKLDLKDFIYFLEEMSDCAHSDGYSEGHSDGWSEGYSSGLEQTN